MHFRLTFDPTIDLVDQLGVGGRWSNRPWLSSFGARRGAMGSGARSASYRNRRAIFALAHRRRDPRMGRCGAPSVVLRVRAIRLFVLDEPLEGPFLGSMPVHRRRMHGRPYQRWIAERLDDGERLVVDQGSVP